MKKDYRNVGVAAAILVGCGIAIGVMAHKIYKDKNKEYCEAVNHLKGEADFKLSKEFLKELKEELKNEKENTVNEVKVHITTTDSENPAEQTSSESPSQPQNDPVGSVEGKAQEIAE